MNTFAILINTTDSFEDCWKPFFTLFKTYWPDYKGKIYLNTEQKEFAYPGLEIISIKSSLINHSWSQCLKQAINFIAEDNILYLQEDYFFKGKVDNSTLNNYFEIFIYGNFDCLHLTDQCTSGPFNKNITNPTTFEIMKGASYRLSTQAAFWRKESLLKLIRVWEDAWQFEYYGTKRSNYLLNNIMIVNTETYGVGNTEIIPYIFTGIIKGRWNKEVVSVFKANNIHINFSVRGFVDEADNQKVFFNRFVAQLNNLRSQIDFLKLRFWRN